MKKAFRDFLMSRGMRVTDQRLAIFEAAFDFDDYFVADQLLERSQQLDKGISRATIYRTLPLLVESGSVRELDIGKDYKLYQAKKQGEALKTQAVCISCSKITEVDAPFLEWYGKAISEKINMRLVSQNLQVTGYCEHCNNHGPERI